MPEGDTVFRTAAALREALVGRTLTRCDVRVPRYATVDLSGSRVEEVLSRGKHLFIRFDNEEWIHVHLGLFGKWQFGTGEAPAPQGLVRLRIATDGLTPFQVVP
mgnify:CR=1 FL=1